jgi:hypothetical protein
MDKIIKILDQIIDELNTHQNIDQYVYDLLHKIEIEVRQPIKIYRNKDRWIYDVQPNYNWTTIDKNETNETNETKSKINLEKLTE